MSSLRAAFGSSFSTAVRSSRGVGLLGSTTGFRKCWLSSYTLNKHFHSIHHFRAIVPGAVTRSCSVVSDKQTPSARIHTSALRCRSEARIDESLNRLDTEIRRVGRIRRQEVNDILEDIIEMKKATSSQSLMIIRCCGELIPEEPPTNRTELVQQVWKTLESLKVPMDVSHYNALLRVYLENEHKFNPTEFLQDLTNKGIEPNRVTYQRLIARFCQDGDIDGASTILQHMKEKQMPINEYVFNALIMGHGQANDMESAEGILGVMKQAGLEPNDDTYVTLMTCYAKNGDIENVRRIVKDCEEKEIFLIDRDYLSVIYALAANNHNHLIDEVLPFLRKHSGFNQEATSLIFRLVNIGQEDVAFKIIKEMTPIVRQEGPVPSGNFFIKHLVQLGRPSETIIKYCKALQDEQLNVFALGRACEFALTEKKFELAMELIEAAKDNGLPIRQHYFWPFFAAAKSDRDVNFGLRCMKEYGQTPNMETLRDYVIPKVLQNKTESVERALHQLSSETGIPLGTVSSSALMHLLSQNEMKLAADFSTRYRLRFGNPMIRRAIIDAYIRTNDADSFAKIIGSSSIDGDDSAREDVGTMLMELVDSIRDPGRKAGLLEPVLKQLLANGLGLSNSGSELLQNNLGESLTPELANAIGQLTSSELTPSLTAPREKRGPMQLEDKSSDELEAMLEEAMRTNSNTKAIKKGLLYSYCRERQVEKLEKLKDELTKDGFVFTPGLHAMFLDIFSTSGKVADATASYEEVIKGLDMRMDDLKILRYAGALQTSGDLEGCLNVLKTAPRDETRKPAGGAQQVAVWRLLNSVAETSPDRLKEVLEVLKDRRLIQVNNVTLGPLVKAYLAKDDLDGALQEFERCVTEYRATPLKNELFCRFIKIEDADRLQKVMDLSTSIHGEVNSMYDLVFAFIDCGKLRQAKKILETPGLRARNDKIELFCQRYCQENRVAELENIIQVTKDLIDIDRNSMYFYLLQAYCKMGDTEKALSVWTSMQEENVQPSVELLVYLADFLRKNNCSVPFVTPDPSEMLSSQMSTEKREVTTVKVVKSSGVIGLPKSLSEFRQCLDMNEVDKALQIKQRMEGDGSSLNITDASRLVHRLASAERLNEATRVTEQLLENGQYPLPATLKFLTARLANAGDINTLEKLDEALSADLKRKANLNSRLCIAYVNADQGINFFENRIKTVVDNAIGANETAQATTTEGGDTEEIGNIPVFGSIALLKRNENLLPEFEALASKAQGSHRRALNNILYVHYMSKKDFPRAQEIWDASLKAESRVLFRALVLDARKNHDIDLAKTVSKHVMSSDQITGTAKAVAFSSVLDVLADLGRIEEAVSFLDETLKTIQLQDYPPSILNKIKDSALATGLKFPYEVPAYRPRNRRSRAIDSSDSD